MKEKKKEGITLIALVITIIVLLILAGVTLSTLFGNNGILTESQLAVEANKEANAKEQVQLAWTACETEYQAAWTKDSSVEKSNYFQKENLNKNLGTGTVKSVNYVENGKSTVTYTLDGTEYEFEITSGQVYKVGQAPDVTEPNPEETKGTLVQSVTKDNYGDTINYEANGVSDWKIFYNDGNNVFIITSDYLPKEKLPSSITTMSKKADSNRLYSVYWNDTVKTQNTGFVKPEVVERYGLSWLNNYPDSNNTNMKCVEDLLNTSKWNEFATGVEGAEAIGGPTVELWINSWNEKYPDNKLFYNIGDTYNSDGSVYEEESVEGRWDYEKSGANYGYLLGPTSDQIPQYDDDDNCIDGIPLQVSDSAKILDYSNTLYFPHGLNIFNGCRAYWIASPSCIGSECIIAVGKPTWSIDAGISGNGACSDYEGQGSSYLGIGGFGLRPVVCLPSDVNATKSGTNWTITE